MGTPPYRSFPRTLALILVTMVAGLTIRFAHLGLPPLVVKYGGSTLWALMIYWIVSAPVPARRLLLATLVAGTIATAVEFLKLYHSPSLDAFRRTLPGIILLGRIFSAWDIATYWIAIAIGALLDSSLRSAAARSAE